ncbi:MAG: subtilisin family serine protease [Planctomycetota bacterium]|jgi:subtilisin family serine protease
MRTSTSEPHPTRALLLCLALCSLLTSAGQDPKRSAAKLTLLVLGKTQLLDTPHGFPEYCEENAKSDRLELRPETIQRLKHIAKNERSALLEALGGAELLTEFWLVNAMVVRVTPKQAVALRKNEKLGPIYAAGNLPAKKLSKDVELTELLKAAKRGPFDTGGKLVPSNLTRLGAPRVWSELGIHGAGSLIVSMDNGVDYTHPDLRGAIWINPHEIAGNGKDDDDNGFVDDIYGYDFRRQSSELINTSERQHGTLTSSLMVGDGSAGRITGVAPRASLMLIRADGGPVMALQAFQYSLEQGADVVNMSFSIPNLKQVRGLWRRMAEHATAAGLVLVSGAGNFQRSAEVPVQIRIPEGIPCVISVGGVDEQGLLANASSTGPVEWGSVTTYGDHPMPEGLIKPDLAAYFGPGLALVRPGSEGGEDGYAPVDNSIRGNSLSAPQVSGTVALMLSANPSLTPWRIKAILEETAKDIAPAGKDTQTGAGLLDTYAAVQRALELR